MSFRLLSLHLPCSLALVACVANPSVVRAEERGGPGPATQVTLAPASRSIQVTGVGEARAMPDEATLDFAVETLAPSAKEASQQNARRMEAVIDALVKAGVPRQAIETRNFNLFPEFSPEPPRPVDQGPQRPRITGYRAVNSVQVRTRELAQLGTYIDRALASGANRVDGVRFELSNPQEAQGRAIAQAVQRARAAADVIAASLGVKLGAVLEASTTTEPVPPVPVRMMARAAGAAEATTPISPSEQTVNATVSLRYAIEGGR